MPAGKSLRLVSGTSLLTLLVLVLSVFTADSLIWHWHVTHGTGVSTVSVTRMVVAPLKGNREEYYMDGTEEVSCSRSLFPQGGDPTCWWLQRHHVVYER